MLKIINGKRYDTDTAEEVASYSNCLGYSDFKHVNEELYRKKTGEFFLYGEGGPMTQYAESCGDGLCGGEKIIPLSVENAKSWVEDHCFGEKYEEIFGQVSEDDSTQTISAIISSSSYTKLKELSNKTHKSMSGIIDDLIRKA